MKITRIGMYPTDCHSDEGEFGNNIVFTRRDKCAPRLKGAAVAVFSEQTTFDCGWRYYCNSLQNCQMVSCSNCAGMNRMKV